MEAPTISIVMPVKDRLDLLKQAVDSILRQSHHAWECLLVDDGSGAETLEFLNCLAASEPRFRMVKRPGEKSGGNVCRNAGLRAANSPWVIFLDSDDCLAPCCLESRMKLVDGSGILVSNAEVFEAEPGDRPELFNVPTNDDPLDRFLEMDFPWQTAGPTWPRQALLELGEFDESLKSWQDWDIHVRALIRGFRFRVQASCDFYFRVAQGSEKVSRKQFSDIGHLTGGVQLMGKIERLFADASTATPRRIRALNLIRQRLLVRIAELFGAGTALRQLDTIPAAARPALARKLRFTGIALGLPGKGRLMRWLWGDAVAFRNPSALFLKTAISELRVPRTEAAAR
jgi:glycosyltransferase involved in cell wall biosynthesis